MRHFDQVLASVVFVTIETEVLDGSHKYYAPFTFKTYLAGRTRHSPDLYFDTIQKLAEFWKGQLREDESEKNT